MLGHYRHASKTPFNGVSLAGRWWPTYPTSSHQLKRKKKKRCKSWTPPPHSLTKLSGSAHTHLSIWLDIYKYIYLLTSTNWFSTMQLCNRPKYQDYIMGPTNTIPCISNSRPLLNWEIEVTLKAPITTAADDKFCDIFPCFRQKKVWYFMRIMKYYASFVILEKAATFENIVCCKL